jgi:hypothetical protein
MLNKNVFFLGLSLLLLSQPLFAQENVEEKVEEKEKNKKLELKPYGFIKGDMVYTTDEVKSFTNAGSLAAPQQATGVEQSAVGFTAQHTRIGLKSTVGEQIKVGGVVEIDFFTNTFVTNATPRIRLGYASVAKGGFEARMGQQWDLFSANNPTTNNTNGNMWYAGNRGFRRAQLQLSYMLDNEKISPMVQFSLGETTPDGAFPGFDNQSGIPMIQARLSGKIMKKYVVGASFASGKYVAEVGTPLEFNYNTSGVSFDFNLPIHKYFSLLGEFSTGTNLSNATLFSVAGNYSYTINPVTSAITKNSTKSMGYWLNATSNITDWFSVVLGYGMDKNNNETFAINNVEKNTVLYGDLIFPIKHGFSVALEYQNIKTVVVTAVDANNAISTTKDNTANVINLSARVAF